MADPMNEILDIVDKMQKRIHENVDIILKRAEQEGKTSMIYNDAYNTALLMEIASIAYAVKQQLKKK